MGVIKGSAFTPELKPYKSVGRNKKRHWTHDALGIISVAKALGPGFDAAAQAITKGTGRDELKGLISDAEAKIAAKEQKIADAQSEQAQYAGLRAERAPDMLDRLSEFPDPEKALAEIWPERLRGMTSGLPEQLAGATPQELLALTPEQITGIVRPVPTVSPIPAMPRPYADSPSGAFYDAARSRAEQVRAQRGTAIPDELALLQMSLDELRNLAQWGLSSDPKQRVLEMGRLSKAASAVGRAELGAGGFFEALGGEEGDVRGREYVLKGAKIAGEEDQLKIASDMALLEGRAESADVARRKREKKSKRKFKGLPGVPKTFLYEFKGGLWHPIKPGTKLSAIKMGRKERRAVVERYGAGATVADVIKKESKTRKGKKYLSQMQGWTNKENIIIRGVTPRPVKPVKPDKPIVSETDRRDLDTTLRDLASAGYAGKGELSLGLDSAKNLKIIEERLRTMRADARRLLKSNADAEDGTSGSKYTDEQLKSEIKKMEAASKTLGRLRGGRSESAGAGKKESSGKPEKINVPMSDL